VSIKNYEKFLKAFNSGEIKRLVVVASLGDSVSARDDWFHNHDARTVAFQSNATTKNRR